MKPLFELVESGRIDPSEIMTHRVSLEDATAAYRLFRDKQDDAVKFVLTPGAPRVLKEQTQPMVGVVNSRQPPQPRHFNFFNL
jgi:hypothetical protein